MRANILPIALLSAAAVRADEASSSTSTSAVEKPTFTVRGPSERETLLARS